MMRRKEFEEKVIEILRSQPMIGCTEKEEIKWKTHEIMKLSKESEEKDV